MWDQARKIDFHSLTVESRINYQQNCDIGMIVPMVETTDNIKTRLIRFFLELKAGGLITSVVADFGEDLASLVIKHGYAPRKPNEFGPKSFKHFDVKFAKNCPSSAKFCRTIVDVMPMIKMAPSTSESIAPLYKKAFNQNFDILGATSGYTYFRKSQQTASSQKAHLVGDYMMFRTERRLILRRKPILMVSKNFLRFYEHGQHGLRFMMLSLAAAEDYLGAKGWVDDLKDRYLCTGQVIDRRGRTLANESAYGGMTSVVIESNVTSPFGVSSNDDAGSYIIEAAPLLHMRALFGQEPSLARGFLVRCTGAEKLGGTQEKNAADRYDAIRHLQDLFSEHEEAELTIKAASEVLCKATGFPVDDFYKPNNKDNWPSGLLVNLPFADPKDASTKTWPIALPSINGAIPGWAKTRSRPTTPSENFGYHLSFPEE